MEKLGSKTAFVANKKDGTVWVYLINWGGWHMGAGCRVSTPAKRGKTLFRVCRWPSLISVQRAGQARQGWVSFASFPPFLAFLRVLLWEWALGRLGFISNGLLATCLLSWLFTWHPRALRDLTVACELWHGWWSRCDRAGCWVCSGGIRIGDWAETAMRRAALLLLTLLT